MCVSGKKKSKPEFLVLGTGDAIATMKERVLLPLLKLKRERLQSPGLFDISITADEVSLCQT